MTLFLKILMLNNPISQKLFHPQRKKKLANGLMKKINFLDKWSVTLAKNPGKKFLRKCMAEVRFNAFTDGPKFLSQAL